MEHDYTILVDRSSALGIRDLAGNVLLANQADGQIRFDILLTDEANDAPQNIVPGTQTIAEGGAVRFANGGASLSYSVGGQTLQFTERPGLNDAVVIELIVPAPNSPLDVRVSGVGTGRANIQIALATNASGTSISTTDQIVEAIQRSAAANALVTATASGTAVFVPLATQLGRQEIGSTFSFTASGGAVLTFTKGLSVPDRVQVELLDPGAANQALSLSVTGVGTGLATIHINLATDSAGKPSSTNNAIALAIQGSPGASSLVSASTTGSGIVAPAMGPRTTANQNPIRVGDSDAFLDRYPTTGVTFTPEDGILMVTLTAFNGTANAGTLTLAGATGLTIAGNATSVVQLTGTVAQINAALNGLVYVPPLNHNKDVSVTTIKVTTVDQGRFGVVPPSGLTSLSDIDVFEINITPVNDPPTIAGSNPPVRRRASQHERECTDSSDYRGGYRCLGGHGPELESDAQCACGTRFVGCE